MREAQGEMALEQFLSEVKEFWSAYEFELVNYQNKCRLIRGWDDLFEKLDENLASLTSMQQSPCVCCCRRRCCCCWWWWRCFLCLGLRDVRVI